MSTKGKSSKTKWSENPFVTECLDSSESNWSIESEGGAYSMQNYLLPPKNTLSKHITFDGKHPEKLEIKHWKRTNIDFKIRKQDYNRLNESWSSRNGFDAKYKHIVDDQ